LSSINKPLKPLRIPAPWQVKYNEFFETMDPDDLKEDILQLVNTNQEILVDLGWYKKDEMGSYRISVVKSYDWDNPVIIKSYDKEIEVISAIEILLVQIVRKTLFKHPCPCCGYRTLELQPPGTYEICDICFWEDDGVQYDDPDYKGGANTESLNEYRRLFEQGLRTNRKPDRYDIRECW